MYFWHKQYEVRLSTQTIHIQDLHRCSNSLLLEYGYDYRYGYKRPSIDAQTGLSEAYPATTHDKNDYNDIPWTRARATSISALALIDQYHMWSLIIGVFWGKCNMCIDRRLQVHTPLLHNDYRLAHGMKYGYIGELHR